MLFGFWTVLRNCAGRFGISEEWLREEGSTSSGLQKSISLKPVFDISLSSFLKANEATPCLFGFGFVLILFTVWS